MDKTTCSICNQTIEGNRVSFSDLIELSKVDPKINKQKVGVQCQHCGAYYCEPCRKKKLKSNIIKGTTCSQCGQNIGKGDIFLSPEVSLDDSALRQATREIEINKKLFTKISSMLEKRGWENNEEIRAEITELLKDHGKAYLDASLKYLLGPQLLYTITNAMVDQIGALAEIGSPDLFANGEAEDLLIYRLTHDKSNWARKLEEGGEEGDTLLPHVVNTLIQIEDATRSGNSIPFLVDTLLNNEYPFYRAETARMLGRVDWDPSVVEALFKASKDHERPKRFEAGSWAPKLKPPSVHERAVLSLAEIGSEESLAFVIPIFAGWYKFAKHSDIGRGGLDTVELLSEIGLKAPGSLIDAVQDESLRGEQIARITTALGKTEHPGIVPVLNNLLNHQDKKVHKAAKKALGRLDRGG